MHLEKIKKEENKVSNPLHSVETDYKILNKTFYEKNPEMTRALKIAQEQIADRPPVRKIVNVIETVDFLFNKGQFKISFAIKFDELQFKESEQVNIDLVAKLQNELNEEILLVSLFNNNGELFEGECNLNTVYKKKPLRSGNYSMLLHFYVTDSNGITTDFYKPLKDSYKFFAHTSDFMNTTLYYYSGTKQLEYNTILKYDPKKSTIVIHNNCVKDLNPSLLYGDIKNKTKRPSRLYQVFINKGFKYLYRLFKIFPVKANKILFASDSREELGGNFEYLYEELVRQGLQNNVHQIFKENNFVNKSFRELIKLAYDFATSEFIFLEENYPLITKIELKEKTELVQLWHAAGAFKKFGYSRLGLVGGPSIDSKDHRSYTKALVTSPNLIDIYAESLDIEKDFVKPYGIPRTDLFFDDLKKQKKIEALHERYPFIKNKKVILFAPTFRGGGRKSAHYPYEYLNLRKIYENLQGNDYVFLFKVHFNTLNKINIPYELSDFFYDVSDYRDINDLMLISDLLITDYSSVCFEFSLLDKPMLFFSPDVENYVSQRGFYYEYKELIPGKLVQSTTQLITAILENDFEFKKVATFRDYFFQYQDSFASKRIVNNIILAKQQKVTR